MVYKETIERNYVFEEIIEDSLITEKNINKYLIHDDDLSISDLMGDSPVIFYAPKWRYELINTDLAFDPYITEDGGESVLDTDILAILPIYGYEHSGISINAGYNRYHCIWDSGQIGYAFITKDMAKQYGLETTSTEKLEQTIINITNEIDKIYQGEVYSVVCEYLDDDNTVIDYDICGGFIGYEWALEALKDEF